MKNGGWNPKLRTNQLELGSTVSSNTQIKCCRDNVPACKSEIAMPHVVLKFGLTVPGFTLAAFQVSHTAAGSKLDFSPL